MANNSTSKRRGRNAPLRRQSLLRLIVPAELDRVAFYDFEIGEKEYAALGFANVHWAYFEEVLYRATAKLSRRARKRIPEGAKSLDFSRRLAALRQLALRMREPAGIYRDALLRLIPRIANANGTRQKLVHGIWTFNPKNPGRLFSQPRMGLPVTSRVESYDFKKMIEFGLSVGELSFSLEAASSPFEVPEGDPKPYMSRSFLLALAGSDPASLGFHWPTPLASPHRRVSYPASDLEKK